MVEHQPAHGRGKLIPCFALLVHAAFTLPIVVVSLSQVMSSHFYLRVCSLTGWGVREGLWVLSCQQVLKHNAI